MKTVEYCCRMRQCKYETFCVEFFALPFKQNCFLWIDWLSYVTWVFVKHLSCNHTTHILAKTRFRRNGQNEHCWPLRAYCNSGRSSVKSNTFLKKTGNSIKKKSYNICKYSC